MNKNILICLEKLGIGGVETAVINQAIELQNQGFKVNVISAGGEYVKLLQDYGINHITYEFELENKFNIEKSKKLINILVENQIGQVHIHQLPCMLTVWYACAAINIPYVAYIHTSLTDIYDWYCNSYPIYKSLLQKFFSNAFKIVAISNDAINNHSKYFNINKDKYILKKNSINFDLYKTNKKVEKVEKFMLISRIAIEKEISIKNGIDFFIDYASTVNNSELSLDVWGDGPQIEEIQRYVAEKNINSYSINFKGATNNVSKVMDNYDIVIGIGRCILEALALKKLAIISGNEEIKFMINKENILEAIEKNFAGKTLPKEEQQNIISKIIKLRSEDINRIVEENYETIKENLNIKNNVYVIENEKNNSNKIDVINSISEYLYDENESLKIKINQLNDVQELQKKEEKELEELKIKNKMFEEENRVLRQEIESIYNSKRWKALNKIARIFNK